MDKNMIIALVRQEMMLAMGCTEPAASALAGAKARDIVAQFGQKIERAEIFASRDLIKNAMSVGIPNCQLKGIQAAVALGISGGSVADGLGILSHITPSQIESAKAVPISLSMVGDVPPLFVQVRVHTCDHIGEATIRDEHDHFSNLRLDGKLLQDDCSAHCEQRSASAGAKVLGSRQVSEISLENIVEMACAISEEEGSFLLDAVQTNLKIAEHGLGEEYGLCVGRTAMKDLHRNPTSLTEAFAVGAALAAAGSDARMAGCNLGVVINSGSGNQGLTVTVPVYIVAQYLKASSLSLTRALFISQCVALVLTACKDRLSALCGAFTASIATACAYVYLLGGDCKVMDRAINVMVGNLTGIICDGAKMTCPLKIHSSLDAAGLAVMIALEGHGPGSESGICGSDSLQAIRSLSRISTEGMEETDKTILSIMLEKSC